MGTISLLLSVAAIYIAVAARHSRMAIFSPVAMTGLYGLLYVVLPNMLVQLGVTTQWSEFVDEADLLTRAQYPFAVFATAAIVVGLLTHRLHDSNAPTFTPAPAQHGYILAIFTLFLVGTMGGSGMLYFLKAEDLSSDLNGLKFLLSFVDLAIPGVSLILFRKTGRLIKKDYVIIVLILFAYAFLGSRYRLVSIFIIVIIYMRWKGYKIFSPRNIAFGTTALLTISFFSVGRSYRQGFDFETLSGVEISDALRALFNETSSQMALGTVTMYVPQSQGYVFFEPFIVALSSIVPRALWPSKPTPEYLNAIQLSLPGPLEKSGAAVPIYGEWYLMGGYLSIFLMGCLVIYILQVLYLNAVRQGRMAVVACLSCFTAYAYTRGYLAQNILAFAFIVAPTYLVHRLGRAIR